MLRRGRGAEAGVLDLNTERHRIPMPRALWPSNSCFGACLWMSASHLCAAGLRHATVYKQPSSPRSVSTPLYAPCQWQRNETKRKPKEHIDSLRVRSGQNDTSEDGLCGRGALESPLPVPCVRDISNRRYCLATPLYSEGTDAQHLTLDRSKTQYQKLLHRSQQLHAKVNTGKRTAFSRYSTFSWF